MHRRSLLAAAGAGAVAAAVRPALAAGSQAAFPNGFLWGAATAAHQVEGNNVSSDMWLLENVKPTIFAEPSGDADNSFELWPADLDLVRSLGLNSYRFSLEWARIEPEQGQFSTAMLDHYKAMIDGCRARGLTPLVTFNHFTTPRWFAARGGWTTADSPDLFVRYCDRAAHHLAPSIGYATTLNEPDVMNLIGGLLPPAFMQQAMAMNAAAARACGSDAFRNTIVLSEPDRAAAQTHLLAAHRKGRAAIKAVRPELPVGFSLALPDDQAAGPNSLRDTKRAEIYGAWLEVAKSDDFMASRTTPARSGVTKARCRRPPAPSSTRAEKRSIPRRWPTRCASPTRRPASRSLSPSMA
jgi:beta-glucosidase